MGRGNLAAYSGITTKIRAMRSRLISDEQFEAITQFESVSALFNYLQSLPTYSEAFSSLNPNDVHRGAVERQMNFSTYRDFSKIYNFANINQKKYLYFYFMKYEIANIKRYMRHVMDSRKDEKPAFVTNDFERHSKIDADKLVRAQNVTEFVGYLRKSEYYKPLSNVLRLKGSTLFDFEMSLDLYYFSYIWNHKDKVFNKSDKQCIEKTFGSKIDLLNILWIYRCRNYYTISNAQIYSFLIPVNYNITSTEIKSMVETNSEKTFFELVSSSYYGKNFGFDSTQPIETQFEIMMHSIYMKDFNQHPYSAAAINAYFYLKDLEIAKVVTTLECIRYGYPPERISKYINLHGGVL